MNEIHTIGHSTHPIEKFIELLSLHKITAVCDVRSNPYSRFNPQYNREMLHKELKKHDIAYVFLGKELGPDKKFHYTELAKTALFHEGLQRLKEGMKSYRIALMCAEKDPIVCHRMILICRYLRADDMEIRHILEDGTIENNRDSEKRLTESAKVPPPDMFENDEDMILRAYHKQSEKIAHASKNKAEKGEFNA